MLLKKRKKEVKTVTKPFLFSVALTLSLLCLGYGTYSTYSALTDYDEKVNEFRLSNLTSTIEEEFEKPGTFEPDVDYTKKVTIKNSADADMFIRVLALPKISKTEAGSDTEILLPSGSGTDGAASVLTIDYNLADWIDGKDGYFYYKTKVAKGASTKVLFNTVRMNGSQIDKELYSNSTLTFEIKVESIGISAFAYRDAWWNGSIPIANPLLEVDNLLKSQTIGG